MVAALGMQVDWFQGSESGCTNYRSKGWITVLFWKTARQADSQAGEEEVGAGSWRRWTSVGCAKPRPDTHLKRPGAMRYPARAVALAGEHWAIASGRLR